MSDQILKSLLFGDDIDMGEELQGLNFAKLGYSLGDFNIEEDDIEKEMILMKKQIRKKGKKSKSKRN